METKTYTCPVEASSQTFEVVAKITSTLEGMNATVWLWKCRSCKVVIAF